MYYPTLDEAAKVAGRGNLLPVYREIDADLETPVSAYLKVARPPFSFLLESVEGGERLARYSFIGTEPYSVLKTGLGQPDGALDPLVPIKQEIDKYRVIPIPNLPRFHGGAVGYLAYDVVRYFEPRVPAPPKDPLGSPEALLMFNDTILVFDHLQHNIKVVSHVHLDGDLERAYGEATARIDRLVERLETPLEVPESMRAPSKRSQGHPVTSNFSREEFLRRGGACQGVYLRRRRHPGGAVPAPGAQDRCPPLSRYTGPSGAINPSPYMYYLHLDDFYIVGASIETLGRVEDGTVVTHPIAGTRPRGATPAEDAALEEELRNQREAEGRAHHAGGPGQKRRRPGQRDRHGPGDQPDGSGALQPGHAPGVPRGGTAQAGIHTLRRPEVLFPDRDTVRCPQDPGHGDNIRSWRREKRGPYGGAVGYFGFSGNVDTAITLRTAVIKDGVAYVQAGGGIVADSTAEDEYEETLSQGRRPAPRHRPRRRG